MRPALVAWVDGVEVAKIECPTHLGGRDWVLGVIAVQLGDGEPRLRANLTGWRAPRIVALAPDALVEVALGTAPRPPVPSGPDGFTLFVDGELRAATPRAAGRAFGHVFCRWHRSGLDDAGYDMTPFLQVPEGVKYQRIASATLRPGQVIGYRIPRGA